MAQEHRRTALDDYGDPGEYFSAQRYLSQKGASLTMTSLAQWAWGSTNHYPGHPDLGVTQYTNYWKQFDNNCQFFKDNNVGWFLHAWRGEDTFDIVKPDGSYVIPNWKPQKC